MITLVWKPYNCRPESKASHCFSSSTRSDTGLVFWELTLKSGSNAIAPEDYDRLKAHPRYKTYLDWGAIEVIEPLASVVIEVGDRPKSLLDYSLEDAEKLISLSEDRDELKLWLDATANPKLKKIIQLRITSVTEGR